MLITAYGAEKSTTKSGQPKQTLGPVVAHGVIEKAGAIGQFVVLESNLVTYGPGFEIGKIITGPNRYKEVFLQQGLAVFDFHILNTFLDMSICKCFSTYLISFELSLDSVTDTGRLQGCATTTSPGMPFPTGVLSLSPVRCLPMLFRGRNKFLCLIVDKGCYYLTFEY